MKPAFRRVEKRKPRYVPSHPERSPGGHLGGGAARPAPAPDVTGRDLLTGRGWSGPVTAEEPFSFRGSCRHKSFGLLSVFFRSPDPPEDNPGHGFEQNCTRATGHGLSARIPGASELATVSAGLSSRSGAPPRAAAHGVAWSVLAPTTPGPTATPTHLEGGR